MGDGDDRPLVLLEMGFQPLDTFRIKVVGRLVEQQYVGLAQQQAAEGDAAPFATGQDTDGGIRRGALEGIHCPFEFGFDVPSVAMLDRLGQFALAFDQAVHLVVVHRLHEFHGNLIIFAPEVHDFLDTLLDNFQDRLVRIHLRLLLQVADAVARSPDDFSFVGFLDAGDDFEEGGFA